MLVAFLRHVHEHLSVPTRVLTRHKAKPGCKVTTILKFSSFDNRCNNGCGRFRANAFNFGNTLAGFRLPEHYIDFVIKKVYTTTKIVEEIIEFRNRCVFWRS